MRFVLPALGLLASTGWALAQGPVVPTVSNQDRDVPARAGDEGALRFAPATNIDWSTAVPKPEPDPSQNRPLPPGFVDRGVSYDVATGVETYWDIPAFDPTRQREFVVGSMAMPPTAAELVEAIWGTPVARNSQNYPFSVQVRMFFTQSGSNFICSGTMVGPKTVVTAGHCVHEGNGGNWSTNVRVSPAWDGDDDRYGSANGTNLGSFTAWTNSGSFSGDMGFICLDRPVGFLSQWLGYGWTSTNSFWTNGNETFYMIGYPGVRPAGHPSTCTFSGAPNQLYQGSGVYDSANSTIITTRVSSGWCYTGGMSGTGIYYFDSVNDRIVVGNHSHRNYTATPNTIGTVRMTQGKFDFLNNTGGTGFSCYSTTNLDLVPLDVNANSSARAGSRLSTFNYLVGNASDVNPASNTYSTDVYLSTNDNISTLDRLIQTHTYTYNFGVRSTRNTNSSSFIRVDPTTKPRIPVDVTPGTYWVGVIISGDAVSSNNDTDGFDAAQITINRRFPVLPSGTLSIPSSGRVITFERLLGTPSYFGVNRLHGDTLATSTDAWVNFGQLAPCIDPFQGSRNLELGVNPANSNPTTPDPIAALVIRLDGTTGVNYLLDFELIDYGEETDEFDGVWISQDGNTWHLLAGPWSTVRTAFARWESIRNIDLNSTPVNPGLPFYLAFAAQDNFTYGGADGIGIDDIRIHQTFDPTLTVSNFYSPGTVQLHFTAGTPNSLGLFAFSLAGGGPLPTPFGTVSMTPPITTLGIVGLNSSGNGTMPWVLPSGLTGLPMWWQGLDLTSLQLTNPLAIRIK